MSAQIIDRSEAGLTVQVTIPYNHSLLESEETLQDRLNAAGVLATQEALRQFGMRITVYTPPKPSDFPVVLAFSKSIARLRQGL